MSIPSSVSTGEEIDAQIGDLISGLIGCVPELGSLLSGIFNVLWGSATSQNNWNAILNDINEIVEQDLTTLLLQTDQNILTGIYNDVTDYLNAVQAEDKPPIKSLWDSVLATLDLELPSFKQTGLRNSSSTVIRSICESLFVTSARWCSKWEVMGLE
jgi:hypothetical protein